MIFIENMSLSWDTSLIKYDSYWHDPKIRAQENTAFFREDGRGKPYQGNTMDKKHIYIWRKY
jgi:hypothetical protein